MFESNSRSKTNEIKASNLMIEGPDINKSNLSPQSLSEICGDQNWLTSAIGENLK